MRSRIRVAFCLDSFAIGGTELNAVRTAEALDRARFDLCVYHLQDGGALRERYVRLGVPLTRLAIRNLYSPATWRQGARLAACLRRDRVDVVHSHDLYCNIFAVPWARLATGCAVIASRRWGRLPSHPHLAGINRTCTRLAHRIVANSREAAERLVRDDGMPPHKIVQLPNFVSAAAFATAAGEERAALRKAWGIGPDAFVVGIVARLAPVKNHDLLLQAMTRLDASFHLVAVGDGPARATLEARVREYGLSQRVSFLGEVAATAGVYGAFDASVLCSVSEGFPNVVIEAMAAARPVVASAVGGVKDAITHGVSGLLFISGDLEGLVAALRRLRADPAQAARIGAAARSTAFARYSESAVIAELQALYASLAWRGDAHAARCADA